MQHNINPFSVPMIFLRVGWMNRYQGQTTGDQISGGGAFVKAHGYGHEIFNFQPFEGKVYGYVQPPGTAYNQQPGPGININRLDASPGDESISRALAIWTATSPQGGSFIVGWYENATIFRHWQKPLHGAKRRHAGDEFGYYVVAANKDATLLLPDERLFQVPRGKRGMGQANVWYADDRENHRQIRTDVLQYVSARILPADSSGSPGGVPKQPDPFLRQEVERAAVAATTAHFAKLGYVVDSVEADNLGWDLNAVLPYSADNFPVATS